MLWTWIVANIGGQDGVWGDEARETISHFFGLTAEDEAVGSIEVHRGERWTLEDDRVRDIFEGAGWASPKATQYMFCEHFSVAELELPFGANGQPLWTDICLPSCLKAARRTRIFASSTLTHALAPSGPKESL